MKIRTHFMVAVATIVASVIIIAAAPAAMAGAAGGNSSNACNGANTFFGYYRSSGNYQATPWSYTLDYGHRDQYNNPATIQDVMNWEVKTGKVSPEDNISFVKWIPTATQKQIYGEGGWQRDNPYRYGGGQLKNPAKTRTYQIDTKNWTRYISNVQVCFFDSNYPAPPANSGGVG